MHQPEISPAAPASLCILRLSAIGDVSHVVPVVRTLQSAWPDTALTWVVGQVEAELINDLPGVEVVPCDKGGGLAAWRDLRRRLAGRRFDILFHMQTALRANVFARAIRAERRIGFDRARARDGHGLFVNERIAPHPRCHVLDGFFDFLRAVGISQRVLQWDVPLSEEDRAFAAAQLPADRPVVALNPAASVRLRNYRNWLPERYAAVADHAIDRGCAVVLTGGPAEGERALATAVRRHMRGEVIDLVGRTSLKQLLAVLERAVTVIAPDTGPAHLGTAAGIPVLGLYATSNPLRTGPYLSREWTVDRYPENLQRYSGLTVESAPWGRRVRHPEAMHAITVDDVTSRLDRLLAGRAQ